MRKCAHAQVRRSGIGFRLVGNLSFTLGGELMVGKPEWLRELEEKQSAKLIADSQAQEISASHKRILDAEINDLWERVRKRLEEIVASAELHGVRFATNRDGENILHVSAHPSASANPSRVITVIFQPSKYAFEVMERGRVEKSVFVVVSNGKLALSDGHNDIPRNEMDGLDDVICRRLLEPFMQTYTQEASVWQRL